MQPLVSVIMPIYNEESFLAQSLESFFTQTIANQCELICVDDGSTDRSMEILGSFIERYPAGVKLLTQDNQGSGKARNAGIDAASGEFIGFLDSDDLYPYDSTLETLYTAAKEHDTLVVGGSLMIYSNGKEYTSFAGEAGFSGHEFLAAGLVEYEQYQFDYGYQRFIYNRDFMRQNQLRFPPYLRYQDPPFFVRAMLAAKRFYALTEPTYKYCPKSNPVQWNSRKLIDLIAGITEVGVLAAEHNLESLFKLNLMRFDVDWRPAYQQVLEETQDIQVLDALFGAKYTMLKARSNLDLNHCLDASPSIMEDIAKTYAVFAQCEQLKSENASLVNENISLQNERVSLQNERAEILASKTWTVGRAVLWLPRTLRDLLKGGA